MPGTFSKSLRPKRPGSYFNFQATPAASVLPNVGGIVAIAATHDWGPYKTPTLVKSLAEFQAVFGPSTTTQAYKAVYQAFKGEGLPGRGGAGSVLVHRFGGSTAAKAVKTLQNTTPVAAITLTAKYEGVYGNSLTATVVANAADPTNKHDLVLKLGSVEIERFTYAKTDITALASAITASSGWVVPSAVTSGVALALVADQAFASGNDGSSTIAAADVTAMLAAIETNRFSLFALGDLAGQTWTATTADAILTTVVDWANNLNGKGKRFITVFGGALDESSSTAITRNTSARTLTVGSTTLNALSDFVNVGQGGVEDAVLGTLSSSQLAPRIAGILAALGEERSLTYARLQGTTPRNFATETEILAAFDAGLVVLSRDSHPDSPVRVEKGLTTWTTTSNTAKPYTIYRSPKYVRTMHGIETEITEWCDQNVIGRFAVSDQTRAYIVGKAESIIQNRVDRQVLQPGATVGLDADPPSTATDEFIGLVYGVKFGRSLEQVFNTVNIS